MRAEPLVSVIVPVFNTGSYVDAALQSIRLQTLENIQIVCVDDGSTDDSLAILRRHAAVDDRVQVITRNTNAGCSVARNDALQRAIGRYVYFFDSDDLLEPEALERLVAYADKSELDAVFFNARPLIDRSMESDLFERYRRQYLRSHDYPTVVEGPELVVLMNARGEWKPSPCLYLARRSLIERAGLRFSDGFMHEDSGFTMRLVLAAGAVGYDPSEYFIRRVRAGSITTVNLSSKHVCGLIVATAEILLASYGSIGAAAMRPELATAIAAEGELIFRDAAQKFAILSAGEQEAVLQWEPGTPARAFVRERMLDRAGLERKSQLLGACFEDSRALHEENDAFRRSRSLKLVRRLQSTISHFRRKAK